MNRATIFATMNGVEGINGVPGVSGGDVRIITILKVWATRAKIVLSTSSMGEVLARRNGLDACYRNIGVPDGPGIYSNVMKIIKSVKAIPRERVTISYSGGEHLYDVVAPAILKALFRIPWLAVVHWVEEYPWRDVRGGTPTLHRYLYWLNRVVAMMLIRLGADKVLAVSESTREKLVKRRAFRPDRVSTVFCGLDLDASVRARSMAVEKTYDAVFMKRLNFGKGVRDLIDIWARVVAQRPQARLQMIGDGPPQVVDEIKQRIETLGLRENIDLIGVVHDQAEKMERLARSRLFVLPSHEENWAIVIGEALAAGLPVIAYDLKEIRPLWGARVTWVPFQDLDAFAKEVFNQLDAPQVPSLDDFLRALDWDAIAEIEFGHLNRIIGSAVR